MSDARPVRTRIAPSPTGDPHVGTAYIALFNYCFAKAHGGQFLLRIEDTDAVRSTAVSEQRILDALRWLGLDWDEGPDVGGDHGPYRQSERAGSYAAHCDQLLNSGHAFRCFCTKERLDELRKTQQAAGGTMGYDGHCMGLAEADVERRVAAGEPYVVRLVVPRDGQCVVHDRFRGEIPIDWQQVDMQVLLKADGLPTYHLANVVDDHLMGITHVIRGEEWINSAPKHLLLYQAFGWEPPELAHMPLLRNPDKSKLSKRRNPTSVDYYRQAGFLPEAVLNYLGRMGWSMPDDRERFALAEMIDAFDIDRISLGGPVFDVEKLRWLNGQWLKSLTDEAYMQRVVDWSMNRDYLSKLLPLVRERAETLEQLVPLADYLIGDGRDLSEASFAHKSLEPDTQRMILQLASWAFESVAHWEADTLQAECRRLAEGLDLKIRDFLFPLFVAISGRPSALPLFDSMAILGADRSRVRIREGIEALGGVGKKQLKKLEKRYAELAVENAGDQGRTEA